MKVIYRGSFCSDPMGTEEQIARSLEHLGHEVVRIDENEFGWGETLAAVAGAGAEKMADLFLWTCTQAFADKYPKGVARHAVETLNMNLPTAAIHLDRYWGLARDRLIYTEPWFKLRHVFTVDGDNDERWKAAGVNHHWLLPAVFHEDCVVGQPRAELATDVAFIGRADNYHTEYPFRAQLIEWLCTTYGDRFRLFPEPGKPGIHGAALSDIYASAKVVVGDSIFADTSRRCTSVRPFEAAARGGFMVYPRIECAAEALRGVEHLRYFAPGDFGSLRMTIDEALATVRDEDTVLRGQAYIREHHTYLNRLRELLTQVGLT